METPIVREATLAFEYSLSNFLWKQAVFFAERLVAECRCDETVYLLALAYFHSQETSRASWHLRGNRLPEARYLLAKCCFLLQRWDEAEDALFSGGGAGGGCGGGLADVVNGAAGLFLLGQVREKQSRREQAIDCYAKCLELCPFMWDAYERWSWLTLGSPSPSRSSSSAAGIAAETFNEERFAQMSANYSGGRTWHAPNGSLGPQQRPQQPQMLLQPQAQQQEARHHPQLQPQQQQQPAERPAGLLTPPGRASQNAPPRNGEPKDPPTQQQLQQHHQPHHPGATSRKERRSSEHAQPRHSLHGSSREHRQDAAPTRKQLFTGGGGGGQTPAPAAIGDGGLAINAGGGCAGTSGDGGSEPSLAALLQKLGAALHAMHSFENQLTIQLLSTLPRRHFETGYIMVLVGLCYFESADYKKAEQVFQQVWRMEPRRIEGLELYSSALWQLRKDVELGHLAQQCLQWDRLKPQVWCVVGNCFSLQKEHDTAIKFFKRAIQVDPWFTYAYTLCGHEFVANEKFDKAIPMYENALCIDSRHYNAWWGLGNIYHRQEEHENARYHFLKALEINKSNSVLRCYLGMVLDSLNNPLMALENFDRASQGEPMNGMAHFQKACVLMSLERFEEALLDLKKVRYLAPKEACVHFQLGKVYMKLQKDRKALLHFNIAMDLNRDSKDYHTIKTHIERLHIRGVKDVESERPMPCVGGVSIPVGGGGGGGPGTGMGRRSQGGRYSAASVSSTGDDRERGDGRATSAGVGGDDQLLALSHLFVPRPSQYGGGSSTATSASAAVIGATGGIAVVTPGSPGGTGSHGAHVAAAALAGANMGTTVGAVGTGIALASSAATGPYGPPHTPSAATARVSSSHYGGSATAASVSRSLWGGSSRSGPAGAVHHAGGRGCTATAGSGAVNSSGGSPSLHGPTTAGFRI